MNGMSLVICWESYMLDCEATWKHMARRCWTSSCSASSCPTWQRWCRCEAPLTPPMSPPTRDARADHVLKGSRGQLLTQLRADIREFRVKAGVDKVIILWTANTECYSKVRQGAPSPVCFFGLDNMHESNACSIWAREALHAEGS